MKYKIIGTAILSLSIASIIECIIEYKDYERICKHLDQIYKSLHAQSVTIDNTAEGCKYLLRYAKLEENKE